MVNFFGLDGQLDLKKTAIKSESASSKRDCSYGGCEGTSLVSSFAGLHLKEYRYYICYGPFQSPHRRRTSWHVHYDLDLNLIQQAIPFFLGSHSFETFCNKHANLRYKNFLREVKEINCLEIEENHLCFQVVGKNFL